MSPSDPLQFASDEFAVRIYLDPDGADGGRMPPARSGGAPVSLVARIGRCLLEPGGESDRFLSRAIRRGWPIPDWQRTLVLERLRAVMIEPETDCRLAFLAWKALLLDERRSLGLEAAAREADAGQSAMGNPVREEVPGAAVSAAIMRIFRDLERG